ncbi:unnamed protein product [Phaedon cochleariae]|uniref:dolichyl-phosphate-mannose--protein mannosyltransferase n=1 Tax=Phaedon cochleariae TaxID=80249 RepID=A0A9P0GSP5_PHACE|nr:unnamed protein product [Phaedon cochleariae]
MLSPAMGTDKPKRKPPRKAPQYGQPTSYACVLTAAILCYANGLRGDFVHDDIPAVTLNKDVLAVNPLGHVFGNDFWGTPMSDSHSHKSYRPLTTLTFRSNYTLFGLNPLWFHLTNVSLHALACVLFTRACLQVAGLRPPFATLAGLLFATHPIHTEAVTGIVGRADVLACVFFLISVLSYHGSEDGKHHTWISTFFGGLSMLAKETGITVFLLNLAHDFYLHWPSLRRTLTEMKWNRGSLQVANRASRILTSLGILLALRLAILQGSLPKFSQQDNPAAFHPSIYVRFLTFCYLAAFNWWLLICPSTLSHDWQMGSIPVVSSVNDSRNFLTLFCFLVLILLAVKSISELEDQKHTPVVLGLCLLVFPFLPATNLFVTVGFVVAERVLYIPSLGYILLVAYGIQLLWDKQVTHRQTVVSLTILLLVTGCLRTIARNRDWRSRESLLRAGLMMLPHNAKMHYNYANFLRDSSRTELAKSHYHTALRLWPSYASAHNNLGTLLSDMTEAENHFLAAIRHSSDHVNAHYNLGRLYRKYNRTSDSENMLSKCVMLEPKFTAAYVELTKLLGPDDPKLYQLLQHALQINPEDPFFGTQLAYWSERTGDYLQALVYYWRSLKSSPQHQEAVNGACKLLRKFGQKSRLFQLLTRWQLIRRIRIGEVLSNPGIYLQEWRLKTELRSRAKVYDDDSFYGNNVVISAFNSSDHSSEESESDETSLGEWPKQLEKKSDGTMPNPEGLENQRKDYKRAPLMVHSLLDSV